jgi:hypothetical protein
MAAVSIVRGVMSVEGLAAADVAAPGTGSEVALLAASLAGRRARIAVLGGDVWTDGRLLHAPILTHRERNGVAPVRR